MENITNSISDTCMFFFGVCVGLPLNYIFSYIDYYLDEKHERFLIGFLQILLVAYIIRCVKYKTSNIGLFSLGVLSTQMLIIKKTFTDEKDEDERLKQALERIKLK